jgi:hypothetical protein
MPAGRFGRLDEADQWSFSSIDLHTTPKEFQLMKLSINPKIASKSLTPASDPLQYFALVYSRVH